MLGHGGVGGNFDQETLMALARSITAKCNLVCPSNNDTVGTD